MIAVMSGVAVLSKQLPKFPDGIGMDFLICVGRALIRVFLADIHAVATATNSDELAGIVVDVDVHDADRAAGPANPRGGGQRRIGRGTQVIDTKIDRRQGTERPEDESKVAGNV